MSWFEELLKHCYGPLQFEPRATVGAQQWNSIIDAHPQGSWWHRYEWLDYCLAYKGGTDYSFAAMAHGVIVAIYPVIREGTMLTLGGNPLVPALLVPNAPGELIPTAMTAGKSLVNIIARQYGIAYADMMLPPSASGPLKQGATFDSDDETEAIPFSTRVIDLTMPQEERWKGIRKSYHQLIRRGQEKYALFHHDNDAALDHSAFEEYYGLHRVQYGNVRSTATYEMQNSFIKNGMAHLYIVSERAHHYPEGAALWYVYKNMAYYASGVYTKDNVAQATLWFSMEDLAGRGVKYAELGWQGHAMDKKGQAVEFFKRGLGGTDWPVPCIRRYFSTHNEGAA